MEEVETVEMLVEGLGFNNVEVRALSSKNFILYFPFEEDLENIDLDFLSIGFVEVRRVKRNDLIPVRKVWVECRGLPMIAWTEINFCTLLRKLGDIIHVSNFLDEVASFQAPKILIETR